MAAYASLVSLMHFIHDLQHHPSPPISLDKQLLDSITQSITYFQEFLHSYNRNSPPPVTDKDEEAADPLEIRIAGAAYAAVDAIKSHIVDCIKQKRDKPTFDEKNSIKQCCGIMKSVIEEMDSIKNEVVMVDTQKKQKPLQVVHDQGHVEILAWFL